jgi:glutamine synthetase adenylyltransferase
MSFDEQQILADLPDAESARRFLQRFEERHPRDFKKLIANRSLLSDVLTIVSFSDYLSATLLENPQYLSWLDRRRRDSGVRSKEELLESFAQFRSTNSTLEPSVLYEKFRRRELLRIFLRDIRRLATIAEITEEISNLADAILESALRDASTEVDNRFGRPQETDAKGKIRGSTLCVVALGKLGSRELNYSSDIDLLFLYSGEGETRGGVKDPVTNREYFAKLASLAVKLIGQNPNGPSAYRVDLRLRPHGSLGAIAMSVADTCNYYKSEARPWERQVLIRSRASAGDARLFLKFFEEIEPLVFTDAASQAEALAHVREAKQRIEKKNAQSQSHDVKLGPGGIREIEFLAQGLQLAHGGRDRWLRSPHTLISLARLAEHGHIEPGDLSELSAAYDFLRRTEHIIQMENGLQTHLLPSAADKFELLKRRMAFAGYTDFSLSFRRHTRSVREIFDRIVGRVEPAASDVSAVSTPSAVPLRERAVEQNSKPETPSRASLTDPSEFPRLFAEGLDDARGYADELSAIRKVWSNEISKIKSADLAGQITIAEAKRLQTALAESSVAAAFDIANRHAGTKCDCSVLALGKLGGRSMDYGSDLDLIIVYADDAKFSAENHSRTVESFINVLSSLTRDGSLYRIDLRLRPHGSKGMIALPSAAFLDYLRHDAAIWELLAFVKLRGLGSHAREIESQAREIIHSRARKIPEVELRRETRRIRLALEESKASPRRHSEVDIKYGPGGMLDIYFAVRYLQIRDDIRDDETDRSTARSLEKLAAGGALAPSQYDGLLASYHFLAALDHALRLLVGRTRRLVSGTSAGLAKVARRMELGSVNELHEQLTVHRLRAREIFDELTSGS